MAFRNFVTQNAKDDLARRVSESQINANNLRGAQANAEIKNLKLKQEEENKLLKQVNSNCITLILFYRIIILIQTDATVY